ncbi:MAG: DUF2845 domain-containing protein [Thiohalocapsa sp.]
MRRSLPSLSLLACLALFALPAHALRCGTKVVSEGDSTMLLLRNCGQPTLKEQFVDRIPVRTYDKVHNKYYTAYDEQPYDVWTYNFGTQRFIQRITIKGGKIHRIESQGYGY